MGTCPFCKGAVDEDVLTFGGRCPSCLIEIPGEEAPTDPGAAARAAREAEEAAAKKKPRFGVIAGVLAAVLAVGAGGFMTFAPQEAPLPEVPTGAEAYKKVSGQFVSINLDDEPEEVEADPQPTKVAKKAPKKTTKSGGTNAKSAPDLPDTTDLTGGNDADLDGVAIADERATSSGSSNVPPPTTTSSGPPAAAAGVLNTNPTRRTSSLDDISVGGGPSDKIAGLELCGEDIRKGAKSVMRTVGNQLTACADRMLKKDAGFSTGVRVAIKVERAGNVAAIDLRPSNTDDPEFIGCMENVLKKTRFPRMCEAIDLNKTYTFGSQR